jgi:RNA polymerase sigma-70 factor (ECF subfamily)
MAPPVTEPIWLEPFPDDLLAEPEKGPEARYAARESISLAFLAALQILPPRQRAVLLLRDVLEWHADEVAALLGVTLSAVNSMLHRARTTLAKQYHAGSSMTLDVSVSDENTRALLDRYIHAWESADVQELVDLLKEDAAFSMPPTPSWYRGRDSIRALVAGMPFAGEARGRWKLRALRANGQPALAIYGRDETGRTYKPFGISVLEVEGGLIAEVTTFMQPALFPRFGLASELAV